jgi:hypothetical protein
MYTIDIKNNRAVSLTKKTFHDLGFKERQHLQEWIYKNPDMLNEKLLMIQKEFNGFGDTNERLDLLAIDENGDLVIIENKLDDSGKDVTWQALKYASYCSSLTKDNIVEIYQNNLDVAGIEKNAEQLICDFLEKEDSSDIDLNNGDQRIILVAANFRKEVTSTVMWLRERGVKIKCIKIIPYILEKQIFVDVEQIIPVHDVEEYLIKIENKKQQDREMKQNDAERHKIRFEFWKCLLNKMNENTNLFQNVNANKRSSLSCGSGYSGIQYGLVITGKYASVGLYVDTPEQTVNKRIFDNLYMKKDEIEEKFGNELVWNKNEYNKASKIYFELKEINIYIEDNRNIIIDFLVKNIIKFDKAIKIHLDEVMKMKCL